MADNLNTWADHLARQRGVATYGFSVTKPGEYILEIRPAGLTIVSTDWRPGESAPIFNVELDNAPASSDDA